MQELQKTIVDLSAKIASITKNGMDEKEKEKEAQIAMEMKEEETKKEAKRAALEAAIKQAMHEDDSEKKDAAIKQAMEDYGHEKNHEAFGDPSKKNNHDAMSDEEKEKEAQIASIINEKKTETINKILQANIMTNPQNAAVIEARLKQANITDVNKEWEALAPSFAHLIEQQMKQPSMMQQQEQKIVPFYANVNQITPVNVDEKQLSASSPASAFAKISTKELLEDMYQ